MYIIIEWDMGIPYPINAKGQGDKYSPPKEFKTKKDAERWIVRHRAPLYPEIIEREVIYHDNR